MEKISINLLPPELKFEKSQEKKKALIAKISVLALIVMIGITAFGLSLRVYQKVEVSRLEGQIAGLKNSLSSLGETESMVTTLKGRLQSISQINTSDPKTMNAFNLIYQLFPQDIKVGSFTVDKTGQVQITGEAPTLGSLQSFFNNLTDPSLNQGKVKSIKINSLSKTTLTNIRFDITIALNESVSK